MRPEAVLATQFVLLAALANGCADVDDAATRADPAPTKPGDLKITAPTPDQASPRCDARCRDERRAEQEAIESERCGPLLDQVSLGFRITTTPSARGNEIGLHMMLDNRSEIRLSGDTWGLLKVSPDARSNRISWGGSSADVLWQQPGTTSSREVWHDRQPPGWHPVGDRVTSFRFDTYVYAPGRGTVACHLPASVTAPPRLVVDHPRGRWTQPPDG